MKKGTGGSGQSFWAEGETLDGLLHSSFSVDEILPVEQIQENEKSVQLANIDRGQNVRYHRKFFLPFFCSLISCPLGPSILHVLCTGQGGKGSKVQAVEWCIVVGWR